MEELFSKAWECGESDCESQWHKSTYWMTVEGKKVTYSVDNYSDGDYEDVEESDLPDDDSIIDSWKEYAKYCLYSERDPLGEYSVTTTRQETHIWQANFRVSLLGVMCVGLRRRGRGKWLSPNDVPNEVREYIELQRFSPNSTRWIFDDGDVRGKETTSETIERVIKLCKENEDITLQRGRLKFLFPVDETKVLADSTYKKKLKTIIKNSLTYK